MNRSAAAIGVGMLAIAAIVGVILFLQLPSPDTPPATSGESADSTPAPAAPAVSGGTAGSGATGSASMADKPAAAAAGGGGDSAMARPGASGADSAAGHTVPSFDVVRVDRKGNVVVAGKAPADCVVTVMDGDRVVGTATADRRGDWVIVPGEPLAVGESQLTLSAKCGDAAPVEAEDVVVLIVPERGTETVAYADGKAAASATGAAGEAAREAVASAAGSGAAAGGAVAGGGSGGDAMAGRMTSPAGSSPAGTPSAGSAPAGEAIAVAVPRDASKPSRIIQSMDAGEGVAINSVDYDEKGEIIVSGRAEPGSTVQVYLNNNSIGTAQADAQGNWRLVPDAPVPSGEYALRADLVHTDGKVVARAEIPFVRGEALADLPQGRIVVIQPGDYLWKIARSSYGTGIRYTLIYEANKAQIRDPNLIYPGQVFAIPRVN